MRGRRGVVVAEPAATDRVPTSESAQHIARVAARLFATHGYDATSVRTIVEEAGVTKPTLYYHFGSKEGLAQALVTRPLTALLETMNRLADRGGDPVSALEDCLEAHFAFTREDPDRGRFVLGLFFGPPGSGPASASLSHLSERLHDAVDRLVDRLAEAGVIEPGRAADCARAFHGMIVISTVEFLYKGRPLGPDLAGRLVVDMLRGFAAPGWGHSKERGRP